MQKTVFLHIGTEKTGSTTLQAVGGLNRATLLKNGVYYPRTPGERNHLKLALFAADGPNVRDLRQILRMFPDDAYELFKSRFADELCSEVLSVDCPRIYLSNEHLSSRLLSANEVGRVADLVRPLAEKIKIVVYLRRQADFFLSYYSTTIKAGRVNDLDPPRNAKNPRYNYEKILSLWADAFGEENIIVRIYDRPSLVGQDVVKDFFSIMNYEPGQDIEMPTDLNVRLDNDALQFLLEFNRYVPPFLEESLNPERGDIAVALSSRLGGPALAIPAGVRRDITKTYEESNAQVARRFLGRHNGKLFADSDDNDTAAPESLELTVQRAVEISAHLWRCKQRELEVARANTAEARRKIVRLERKIAQTKKIQ